MVINSIVGVYIPIVRIPIKRWDDHPQYSDFWPWHIWCHRVTCFSTTMGPTAEALSLWLYGVWSSDYIACWNADCCEIYGPWAMAMRRKWMLGTLEVWFPKASTVSTYMYAHSVICKFYTHYIYKLIDIPLLFIDTMYIYICIQFTIETKVLDKWMFLLGGGIVHVQCHGYYWWIQCGLLWCDVMSHESWQ